jgi:hypothetical protein
MPRREQKPLSDQTGEAIRRARTIGELERLAGIASDLASRQAFWTPFMHLAGSAALDAGCQELRRRIRNQASGGPNQ